MTNPTNQPRSTARRWPLIVVAASAAVAIWSGWVRLGALHAYVAIEDDNSAKAAFLRAAMNDSDQFWQHRRASVASLRRLIGFRPEW